MQRQTVQPQLWIHPTLMPSLPPVKIAAGSNVVGTAVRDTIPDHYLLQITSQQQKGKWIVETIDLSLVLPLALRSPLHIVHIEQVDALLDQ